jgi:hypothetical protein
MFLKKHVNCDQYLRRYFNKFSRYGYFIYAVNNECLDLKLMVWCTNPF